MQVGQKMKFSENKNQWREQQAIQQAIKRGCTATRIQAIDLNVAPDFNQLLTNAAQAV